MSALRQLHLSGFEGLARKEFGGSLIKGNPRESRPVSIKRPMHVVVRSTRAVKELSFLNPKRARRIELLVHKQGGLCGVKVFRYANSGNHLHLIVMPTSRKALAAFLRAICGLIARFTLGAERGSPDQTERGFWDARPFTRIVEWGRDFRRVCAYLRLNVLEAIGFVPYRPRSGSRPPRPKPGAPPLGLKIICI